MIGDAVAIVISRNRNIADGAELQQSFAEVAASQDVPLTRAVLMTVKRNLSTFG